MIRSVLFAALVASLPLSALADEFTSTLVAYDREAGTLLLADKTFWELPADFVVPAGLTEGDKVRIIYGAESGISAIQRLGPDGQPLSAATGG